MSISYQEYDALLAKCYDLKGAMENAASEEGFKTAQQELRELSENLQSSSGDYTPSLGHVPRDRKEADEHIQQIKSRQSEAKDLMKFAVFARFVDGKIVLATD